MAVNPCFGVDDFNKSKIQTQSETIAHDILTLLFGRPGFFPSEPELGMDIGSLLYSFFDEINIEALKAKLIYQCSKYSSYIVNGEIDIRKTYHNSKPLLLFIIPVEAKTFSQSLVIAITTGISGQISFNFNYV